MLTNEILQALKGYAANMQKKVTFVLQAGTHDKRDELVSFLSDIAGVSDNLAFEERDTGDTLRSPISFLLEADGEDTGIRFSGIPAGHEFNSLVLAFLHASGTDIKLDDSLQRMVANAKGDMHFEVFISLSCHNCPDVVQALNQFALLNPNIRAEMIDGGLFQDVVNERDIQGVPSVYLNGELFANGKVTAAELIDKLLEHDPSIAQAGAGEKMPLQDVTVIGGGPAGVASAIYSARKGLKVTLIADRIGGQVKDTMDIENLISVKKTTGPELSGALQAHMNDYDVTVKEHLKVARVEKGDIKTVVLSSGEEIDTKTVIVATGAKWRELGVPGEKENIGNGVAYCPHCDGPLFKGKRTAVIGGGNSGIEAAIDLAGIVAHVTVFEFADQLKADAVLVSKLKSLPNVTIHTHAQTTEITGADGKVNGIRYKDRTTGDDHWVELEGVFVQIGLVPNTEFLKGTLELSKFGEIVVDAKGHTNVPGVFAAGDCTTVPFKQIVIAAGDGAKAALSAFDHLIRMPVLPESSTAASAPAEAV